MAFLVFLEESSFQHGSEALIIFAHTLEKPTFRDLF